MTSRTRKSPTSGCVHSTLARPPSAARLGCDNGSLGSETVAKTKHAAPVAEEIIGAAVVGIVAAAWRRNKCRLAVSASNMISQELSVTKQLSCVPYQGEAARAADQQ